MRIFFLIPPGGETPGQWAVTSAATDKITQGEFRAVSLARSNRNLPPGQNVLHPLKSFATDQSLTERTFFSVQQFSSFNRAEWFASVAF
jgi:hypothetical protein